MKLENERQALEAFVRKFDSLSTGLPLPSLPTATSKLNPPMPTPGGAAALFAQRQRSRMHSLELDMSMATVVEKESPVRLGIPSMSSEQSLLEEEWDPVLDVSFGDEAPGKVPAPPPPSVRRHSLLSSSSSRDVLGGKENLPS